ncbi:MAG: hypothetical protein KDA58_14165 [Planctomycetaceae bacterium]|nr:hypothetical protein [Planctomycetaceae bacterium]
MNEGIPISRPLHVPAAQRARRGAWIVPLAVICCWGLVASSPITVSMVTVFLFAGLHNWFELRFFLERMPARWGTMSAYFSVALGGVLLLSVTSIVLVWSGWTTATSLSVWLTGVVLWGASLLIMNADSSDWTSRLLWLPPALLLVACVWLFPYVLSVALVYLHPCIGFCVLTQELRRRRPQWKPLVMMTLGLLPVLLIALCCLPFDSATVSSSNEMSQTLARHAGAGVIPWISNTQSIAIHAFLELLHYAVWIVAIPLLSYRATAWSLAAVPLMKRSQTWAYIVPALLALCSLLCVALWGGLLVDYLLVRQIYFTVAIVHVLAEIPFVIRGWRT